jgi:OOP family OmpA-OmpF porin
MAELRRILVREDERRFADALPAAVALRTKSDRKLAIALEPILADTLHDVATRHPEKFADALQPIVGQAVAKAVAAAFASLLERVNQALEHTFSVRALRWRLEAARTGRPYAEIVLLHSLVYRVEQVFLIHRRTGHLLAHASAEPGDERDPDQIAAMLNVIEKFVHDAFRGGETLTRFEVGELQGRSEIGAEAAITAVVRGAPPEDLCRVLREALERIHLEYHDALLDFRGDTAPFASAEAIVAGCLKEQKVERRRSPVLPILAAVIAGALLALLGRGIAHRRSENRRLEEYASALREQPGVVVTDARRDGDAFVLTGLRDPFSPEPAAVLAARGLDPSRATLRLQPF